ncbi:hypothetical protein [uncultured Devosia sp.]|uniref:hypothetical protein n=1 Tax=uncultured Devosia sp. TaxID=211434 RepID=UPI00261AACDC|nr:hypothetical protein [uncultured Devosia sp.]
MLNLTGIGLVAAALAGSLVAGSAAWFGRGLVADHIQIPAIIEEQDRLCEAATEKAAADAVAAEQLRQFKIAERVTQRFIDESQTAADDAQALRDALELEIDAYEQRLDAAGESVCALDAAALDLIGVHTQPDRPGGR